MCWAEPHRAPKRGGERGFSEDGVRDEGACRNERPGGLDRASEVAGSDGTRSRGFGAEGGRGRRDTGDAGAVHGCDEPAEGGCGDALGRGNRGRTVSDERDDQISQR